MHKRQFVRADFWHPVIWTSIVGFKNVNQDLNNHRSIYRVTMASAVRSKIASFESHNQNVRSSSPSVKRSGGAGSDNESMNGRNTSPSPSRDMYSHGGIAVTSRDPSGHQRSSASPMATPSAQYPRSNASTSRNYDNNSNSYHKNGVKTSFAQPSSAGNGSLNGLEQLPFRGGTASAAADLEDGISESGSFTSAASASRKTRLRQQQLGTATAIHHPVNLMEKRKQIKERRMRAAGAAASSGSADQSHSETAGAAHSNDVAVKYSSATATATTAVSSSGTASKNMSRRMIAAKKAGYRPSGGTKLKQDEKPTSPRLNHFHGTAPVITPSQSEETTNAISQSRSESSDAHASDEASSPNRRESRRSKMMRVQRIKGNANSTSDFNKETCHRNAGDGHSNNDAIPVTGITVTQLSSAPEMSQHMQQTQNLDITANITAQSQGRGQVSISNANMNKKRSNRKSSRNRESIASSTMTTATMSTAVAGGSGGAGEIARQSVLREQAIHTQDQRLQPSHDQLPLHNADVNNYKARASSPAPTSRQHPQNSMMLSTPPESPHQDAPDSGNGRQVHSRNVALEPAGITLSPQIDGSEPGFSPLMGSGMSPRSGTDVCSDINDTSVLDPTVMDDEATLTSVRRIMAPKSTPTHSLGRGPSDDLPYDQHQRPRRDADGHLLGDEHQNSQTGKRDGVFRNSPSDTPTSQYSGRNRRGLRRNRGSWLEDEKSDKGGHHGVFQTASSSDYDTDGDISKTSNTGPLTVGQSHSQATDVTEFFNSARGSRYNNRRQADDDRSEEHTSELQSP